MKEKIARYEAISNGKIYKLNNKHQRRLTCNNKKTLFNFKNTSAKLLYVHKNKFLQRRATLSPLRLEAY